MERMPLIYVGRARFEEGGRPHFSINAYRHKWMPSSGGTFISKQRLIARRPSRNLRDKKSRTSSSSILPFLLRWDPCQSPLHLLARPKGTRETTEGAGRWAAKATFAAVVGDTSSSMVAGGGNRGGRLFCPSLSLCIPDSITWPSSLFFFFFPPCVLSSLPPPGLTIT